MKTMLIFGGNGDIGSAIVKKFKENNFNVIAPPHQELDLSSRDELEKYLDKNCDMEPDVLIQCAGWNTPKIFEEIKYEDIDKANSINTLSFYRTVQYYLPKMKKKNNGHILAISSLYGSFARARRLAYVMSKHSLNGMVKTMAIEFGPFNIKVNSLSPGFVDTVMTRKNNNETVIKSFQEKIPLDRLGSTEDIANAAYFLCSFENNYITGQDIVIDGGYSIGGFQK